MCAGECKLSQVVIKCRRFPGSGGMALGAIVREAAALMVRVIGSGERSRMTAVAIERRAGVAIAVASFTLKSRMGSSEGEFGQIVVKICRLPGSSRVTLRAIVREAAGFMIGVICPGKCGLVTAETIEWGAGVAIAVASLTLQRSVRTR